MSGSVDVLAVMDRAIRHLCPCGTDCDSSNLRDALIQARHVAAEMIEAVEENRRALEAFAQDGKPENYFPFDDSERRVLAALRRVRGEA